MLTLLMLLFLIASRGPKPPAALWVAVAVLDLLALLAVILFERALT